MKLRDFDIYVPIVFEEEILKHAQRYKEALVNNTGERGTNKTVSFKRRKIKLGFHNGWKLVNELVRSLQTVDTDKETQKTYIALQAIDDDDEL
jgi:hypothetical protein